MEKKAVIVGAGISGLTTAVCLSRIGWKSVVLEQNDKVEEIGYGIQISPNGTNILNEIGVKPDGACVPNEAEVNNGRTNKTIIKVKLGQDAIKKWGSPYITIGRNELIKALKKKAEQSGKSKIKTNTKAIRYKKNKNSVTVVTEDGKKEEGNIVVVADGLFSKIRNQITNAQPQKSKYVAWRGTIETKKLKGRLPENTCVWVNKNKHAVTTRINDNKTINVVVVNDGNAEDYKNGWHPVVSEIINGADNIKPYPLGYVDVEREWNDGPVVLVGDAAHTMMPSMAQGAVMAIEDCYVFAKKLEETNNPELTAQLLYEERSRRIKKIKKMSEDNIKMFGQDGIKAKTKIVGVKMFGRMMSGMVTKKLDEVYGWKYD